MSCALAEIFSLSFTLLSAAFLSTIIQGSRSMLFTGAELALENCGEGGAERERRWELNCCVCARVQGPEDRHCFSGATIYFFYPPILWIRLTGIQPGR